MGLYGANSKPKKSKKGSVIMKYSYFKMRFLPRVIKANKLPLEEKEKRLQLWTKRFHLLFNQGSYDLAYEYMAMLELNNYLDLDKSDHFRIMLWRMFVTDFRRAFSDYEEERFGRLKNAGLI